MFDGTEKVNAFEDVEESDEVIYEGIVYRKGARPAVESIPIRVVDSSHKWNASRGHSIEVSLSLRA